MAETIPPDEVVEEQDSLDEATMTWSQSWHLPVLIVGSLMLVVGIMLARPREEPITPGTYLDKVAASLEVRDYETARAGLDTIAALEETEELTLGPADRLRREMLWGDTLYLEQFSRDESLDVVNRRIVEHYDAARAFEVENTFDDQHLTWWATTLVSLGKTDDALKKLDELKEARRHPILRRIIEGMVDKPDRDDGRMLALLTHFEEDLRDDAQAGVEPSLWATELRARVLLEDDQYEAAIDFLDRRMALFMDLGAGDQLQPLMVRRAQASQQLALHDIATFWFNKAQIGLAPTSPLHGDILVGLGQIALAQSDDTATALAYFTKADDLYANTPAQFAALVGRADCEARGGTHGDAREHFAQAIKLLPDRPQRFRENDRETLRTVLETHYGLNFDQQRYELALDYLTLATRVGEGDPPADLLLALARTHEKLGEKYNAMGNAPAAQIVPGLASMETTAAPRKAVATASSAAGDPPAKEINMLAAEHFENAADYYHKFARAMTVHDDVSHGNGLWLAALNYDRAERHKKAIEAYVEFVQKRPDDPRALAARNHLGKAFMAEGQYDTARQYFADLIEERPKSPDVYDSYVPLAQCHIALGEADAAERVLLFVVDNHPSLTPESSQYQDALIELGKLYYTQKQYERAIERLDEATQRYADSTAAAGLKYRLANAYRRSVEAIDADRSEATTQSRRQMLSELREKRLRRAEQLFDQAIRMYDTRATAGRTAPSRTALDEQFYRNAFFYRADCVYDLGQFRDAIPLYDVAAMKFEKDPASLVALVQIVNAYCALGDSKNARVANERARWQLRRIPDGAFDDPSLPMNKALWEAWLRNSSEMGLFDQKTNS